MSNYLARVGRRLGIGCLRPITKERQRHETVFSITNDGKSASDHLCGDTGDLDIISICEVMMMRDNIPRLHDGFYVRQYDKAMQGKSLRAAINSKCLDCCCWEKTEVRDCTAISCPLYAVRPYRQKAVLSDSEAVMATVGN